jgi:hypothetical protein
MAEFEHDTGWVLPPPIGPNDELTTVDTQWGPMQKWKARSLAIGWLQRQTQLAQTTRDDSADASIGSQVTPLKDEDKPPPVVDAADETERETRAPSLSDEDLKALEDACDRLDARLTALEQRRDAERKLEELEDALLDATGTGIAPDEEGQPINLH